MNGPSKQVNDSGQPGNGTALDPVNLDAAVLHELDRFRLELLANISQEIRSPLTTIKGFASTLLQPDVKWTDEQQREFLEAIEHEIDRLGRVIAGLLNVSWNENRPLALEKVVCRVSDIVNSVLDGLHSLSLHHHLVVRLPLHLPLVYVDPGRIGEVFLNLVHNAARYSREGGPIIIQAEDNKREVVAHVIDRGVGIPARLRDKVFDRFFQIENIVNGRPSRIDISLPSCRSIIEAHGGRIWMDSQVGSGSCFSFTLPVKDENRPE